MLSKILEWLFPKGFTIHFWMKGLDVYIDGKYALNTDIDFHHIAFIYKGKQ